jgi:hypothetical protein
LLLGSRLSCDGVVAAMVSNEEVVRALHSLYEDRIEPSYLHPPLSVSSTCSLLLIALLVFARL